jgi:hypothetical protein
MNLLLSQYAQFKLFLTQSLGVQEDLLHVHAGLLIFFATAVALRRRMRSRVPIALVYLFAMANEVIDLFSPGSARNQWEPLVDVANTVFWPTLLFLLARRRARDDDPDRTAARPLA